MSSEVTTEDAMAAPDVVIPTKDDSVPEEEPPPPVPGSLGGRKSINRSDRTRKNVKRKMSRGVSMVNHVTGNSNSTAPKDETLENGSEVKKDSEDIYSAISDATSDFQKYLQDNDMTQTSVNTIKTTPPAQNATQTADDSDQGVNKLRDDKETVTQHSILRPSSTVHRVNPLDDYPEHLERLSGTDESTDWGELFNSAAGALGSFLGQVATQAVSLTSSAIVYVSREWDDVDTWHECDSDQDEEDEEEEFQDASEDLTKAKRKIKRRYGSKRERLVPKDRVYHICNELMTTEEAYVERLGLLVKAKEKATKILGADQARHMFMSIEVIYQFHHDYLLPQLRDRMKKWLQYEKIGDVMRKLTPFLKLYTEYVKEFQKASALVDTYEKKSSSFASALEEIRENQSGRHGKLKVQAHMMEPVQRVPRYELLLRDYLKRIPETSPDREDAQKALESVAQTASHFEEMIKRDSRIGQLMQLQSRIEGNVNIAQASRHLVREGRINSINKTTGKLTEKQIYLFSDMLLVCNKMKVAVSTKFKVKHCVNLNEIEVGEGTNLEVPNNFCIKCRDITLEFCTSTKDERLDWMKVISETIAKRNGKPPEHSTKETPEKDKTVLENGMLQLSTDEGKTWKKRHFIVYSDGTVNSYKTNQDQEPITSVRTDQFSLGLVDAPHMKKSKAILLIGPVRKYYLQDDDEHKLQRWLQHFKDTQ